MGLISFHVLFEGETTAYLHDSTTEVVGGGAALGKWMSSVKEAPKSATTKRGE